MLKPEFTGKFKRDYKAALKRGLKSSELETVVTILCCEEPLPSQYRDHSLNDSKDYKNMRECHINPNWLLIYQIQKENLIFKLVRTGSHSDLF